VDQMQESLGRAEDANRDLKSAKARERENMEAELRKKEERDLEEKAKQFIFLQS
jgi:hypothetical protein